MSHSRDERKIRMMNKSKTRIVAWLLTLVMVLNLSPVPVFAEEVLPVNDKPAPTLGAGYKELETVSEGTPPNEDKTFDVQYVIEGTYTYNGKNLILEKYGETGVKGNPSSYSPKHIPECNDDMKRTWEEGKLTFLVQPNQGVSIHIRYMMIYTKRNSEELEKRTFGEISDGLAGLFWDGEHNDTKDSLDSQEALKPINNDLPGEKIELKQYNGKDIRKALSFYLPEKYMTGLESTIKSAKNVDYNISYYGYSFDQNTTIPNITTENKMNIYWQGSGDIVLYYLVGPKDGQTTGQEETTKYTITWVDGNGDTLYTEKVNKGTVPVYTGDTPTKNSDTEYNYSFNGQWSPNIVAANDNATYTARFSSTEIQRPTGNATVVVTIILNAVTQGATVGPHSFTEVNEWGKDWNKKVTTQNIEINNPLVLTLKANQKYDFTVNPFNGLVINTIATKSIPESRLNNGAVSFTTGTDNGTIYLNEAGAPNPINAVKHKVTYVYAGDVPTGITPPAEAEYAKDEAVTIADAPVAVDGYTFTGWKIGDAAAANFTMGEEDVTITGTWKQNKEYTIHHYLKDTTIPVKADETGNASEGSTVSATLATTYSEKDLTTADRNPTTSITITDGDNVLTIYYTLPLTITAKTDSKTYDEQPLNGSYTITGALNDDVATIETALGAAPSITNVSESPKSYLTEADQAGITGIPTYYDVTYTPGSLTITKTNATFGVTFNGDSFVYDGEPHNLENEATYSADGENWTTNLSSLTATNAGDTTIRYRATNPNYNNPVTGEVTLSITARPVLIAGTSETKEYTGTTITINEVTATKPETAIVGGLLDGHTHNAVFSASGVEASTTAYNHGS